MQLKGCLLHYKRDYTFNLVFPTDVVVTAFHISRAAAHVDSSFIMEVHICILYIYIYIYITFCKCTVLVQ